MARWRSSVALGLGVIACSGCAPRALVALPSNASRWIDDSAAAATKSRVTVEARTRGWAGTPPPVDERATPVFVRISNGGSVPLRLSPDAFALVAGTRSFRTLAPDALGARRAALPTTTLAPGASASGFLYFEPVIGRWGFVDLRTSLVDAASGALLDTIDVPFASGHLERCARTEEMRPRDWLFRTCLP